MKGMIVNAAALIWLACLLSGCAKEDFFVAEPAMTHSPSTIPEAYLSLPNRAEPTPNPVKEYPNIEYLKGDERTPPDISTPSNTAVSLEPANIDNLSLFRLNGSNYLITKPLVEDANIKISIKNCADRMNALQNSHSNVKFYTYFITRATDCNWYSHTENLSVYDYADYFSKMLGADTKIKCGRYQLKDLQDYMETGYKTDFHVNYLGSHRIYTDIYAMLSRDFMLSALLTPAEELDFGGLPMIGDLFDAAPDALTLSVEEMDIFKAYRYNYGEYTSFVNDKQMVIGLEEDYKEGNIDRDPHFPHQFSYYGGQSGVVRFEFNHPDMPNLLLLSDSQGRPSRKLLANHFNRTIFLDDIQWRSMDVDKIIQENNIGVVILMGQISMFEIYDK